MTTLRSLSLVAALATAALLPARLAQAQAPDDHPIKKLALARADAEIAVRGLYKQNENSDRNFGPAREKAYRALDAARQVIQKVREREQAKPDDQRNQTVFMDCDDEWRRIDQEWRQTDETGRDLEIRLNALRQRRERLGRLFDCVAQTSDVWKDLEYEPGKVLELFGLVTAEAGKALAAYQALDTELNDLVTAKQGVLDNVKKHFGP